ncbi:alpha/beta fold hydrolase [Streptomyces sp. NPDC020983]|uniref:alpha/beta fold hydrolase n=1 Tax=Streptomyces sp. NPDC020983 TaxID=3365106 RepID=UPI0037AAD939
MNAMRTFRSGGVRLAYEQAGPAGGSPLLLLHALGENRGSWDAVADALAADGWRTTALDLRGHGDSDHADDYTFETMRDDVFALLGELGLDEVTVVAHSLGTVVASLVAMDRPSAVRRMVLEDGPLPFPADPPRPVPADPGPGPGPAGYDWRVVAAVARQRNAPPARHLEGLAEITAPTLVIGGGPRSHIPQDQLAEVAARIPGARLTTIPAGHMIHDDRLPDFLTATRSFLSEP